MGPRTWSNKKSVYVAPTLTESPGTYNRILPLTENLFYNTVLSSSCNLCDCGLLPSCWATILRFISRVIIFVFFFSPEAGDTDGHFFRHDGTQKQKTQPSKITGNTVHWGVSALYSRDQISKCEVWFALNAYHCNTVIKWKNLR